MSFAVFPSALVAGAARALLGRHGRRRREERDQLFKTLALNKACFHCAFASVYVCICVFALQQLRYVHVRDGTEKLPKNCGLGSPNRIRSGLGWCAVKSRRRVW